MAVKVKVNLSGFNKKMAQVESAIKKGSELGMTDITELGKRFARDIAPYDTGWTYESIRKKTRQTKDGVEGKVYILPSKKYRPVDGVHRRTKGAFANFDLVWWMHTSAEARRHIQSGNPRFMYATADFMEGVAVSKIKKRYDEVLMRFK